MNPTYLGQTVAVITCMLLSYESIAETMAVQFDHFLVGMLQFMNTWFSSFLFAGVVISVADVPWPFRLFVYISPLRWGLETLIYLDTVGDSFAGATEIDSTNANTPLAQAATEAGLTYFCTDVPSSSCFGGTGHQVLSGLHSHFDAFDDIDNTGRNIAICIALFIFFKLNYMMLLNKRVSTSAPAFSSAADFKQKAAEKLQVEIAAHHETESHSRSASVSRKDAGEKAEKIVVAPAPVSVELTSAALAVVIPVVSAESQQRGSQSLNETEARVTIHL